RLVEVHGRGVRLDVGRIDLRSGPGRLLLAAHAQRAEPALGEAARAAAPGQEFAGRLALLGVEAGVAVPVEVLEDLPRLVERPAEPDLAERAPLVELLLSGSRLAGAVLGGGQDEDAEQGRGQGRPVSSGHRCACWGERSGMRRPADRLSLVL